MTFKGAELSSVKYLHVHRHTLIKNRLQLLAAPVGLFELLKKVKSDCLFTIESPVNQVEGQLSQENGSLRSSIILYDS